jgi:hypothetical protein
VTAPAQHARTSAPPPADRLVASLACLALSRRTRRALGVRAHARISVVVTDRRLTLLAHHHGHTEVALCCPREAARVRSHETVWPGGDFVVDRIVLEAGGTAVELQVDGRLHEQAAAVVAALGGTSEPPRQSCITRKANQ